MRNPEILDGVRPQVEQQQRVSWAVGATRVAPLDQDRPGPQLSLLRARHRFAFHSRHLCDRPAFDGEARLVSPIAAGPQCQAVYAFQISNHV